MSNTESTILILYNLTPPPILRILMNGTTIHQVAQARHQEAKDNPLLHS